MKNFDFHFIVTGDGIATDGMPPGMWVAIESALEDDELPLGTEISFSVNADFEEGQPPVDFYDHDDSRFSDSGDGDSVELEAEFDDAVPEVVKKAINKSLEEYAVQRWFLDKQ